MTSSSDLPESTVSLLGELYKSRWEQVRHLNDLDQRSIIMAGSAIGAIIAAFPQLLTIPKVLAAALSIIAAIICYGAMYSTIRNRTQLEYCLASINRIELWIKGLVPDENLFPIAGRYRAPTDEPSFVRRIRYSIRGPIIRIFAVALAGSLFNLLDVMQWFPKWMSGTLAGLISLVVLRWCIYRNFRCEQANYIAINRQLDGLPSTTEETTDMTKQRKALWRRAWVFLRGGIP